MGVGRFEAFTRLLDSLTPRRAASTTLARLLLAGATMATLRDAPSPVEATQHQARHRRRKGRHHAAVSKPEADSPPSREPSNAASNVSGEKTKPKPATAGPTGPRGRTGPTGATGPTGSGGRAPGPTGPTG